MGGLPGFRLGGDVVVVVLLFTASSVLSFPIFVFPPSFLVGSFMLSAVLTEDATAAAADESCTDVKSCFFFFGIRGRDDESTSFDPSLGWVLLVFIYFVSALDFHFERNARLSLAGLFTANCINHLPCMWLYDRWNKVCNIGGVDEKMIMIY